MEFVYLIQYASGKERKEDGTFVYIIFLRFCLFWQDFYVSAWQNFVTFPRKEIYTSHLSRQRGPITVIRKILVPHKGTGLVGPQTRVVSRYMGDNIRSAY
jgi:hypothetical protein